MKEKEVLSNISKCFSDLSILFEKLSNQETVKKTKEKKEEKQEENITFEEVRGILANKSREGFTAQIKELLKKYGAIRLSDIDPSKYKDLVSEVKELKNE
ncbi:MULTISPECIES: hypothetical protein [Helcococcus]|uniref:rRNA biogenesis protein rrp5 n=1 Tax=Helcococcus bovis TaxID=3153252 RepID=A0ABW9F6I6_9FIRM